MKAGIACFLDLLKYYLQTTLSAAGLVRCNEETMVPEKRSDAVVCQELQETIQDSQHHC